MPNSVSGRRFAPRLHWSLLALAGITLFASLGLWQLERAEEKRALFDDFAAGAGDARPLPLSFEPVQRYRRIHARGVYDATRQFLLDNMTLDGVPGLHVLTPLLLPDDRVLLVNRGFIRLPARRDRLPALPVDGAPRQVTGRADFLPRAAVKLEAPTPRGWPRMVSFPRMEDIREALGAEVFPQVLLLDAGEPDGFARQWQPPGMPPERHVGYAVQWFGLAVTVLATWVVLSFRRKETPT